MLLSAVLFVLFLAGCWLYCLTDAALTPAAEFRGLRKNAWIYLIAATFVVGAVAWLITRRSWRTRSWVTTTQAARGPLAGPDAVVARHPAARSRRASRHGEHVPQGPDDDPEFLRQLDRRIRGTSADSGELPALTAQPARQGGSPAPSQPRRTSTAASPADRAQRRTVTSRSPKRTIWMCALDITDVAKLQRKHDPRGDVIERVNEPPAPPHPLARRKRLLDRLSTREPPPCRT